MAGDYIQRYYNKYYAGHYQQLEAVLSKQQLLALAALLIELDQPDWLEEIKQRLKELDH